MKQILFSLLFLLTTYLGMAQETILSPFKLKADELKSLALINIEKDADSIYLGFEPQLLKNENGEGMLVIGYRIDKKVDVYYQPQLQLTLSDYDGLGNGANRLKPVPLEDAYLRFSEKGLHAFAAFEDIAGRKIVLEIDEQNQSPTKPFGLLAPVGTDVEHPTGLMMIFLEDFYFVRQTDTKVRVQIDGKSHKLDPFMSIDGKKMYFSRYSKRPVIVTLNPNFSGKIEILPVVDGKARNGDNHYTLQHSNGKVRIENIRQEVSGRTVTLNFLPAFPDIRDVKNGEEIIGKFSVAAHEKTGSVSGTYSVKKQNGTIYVSLIPSEGWKPYPKNRFIVKVIFTMAKTFRRWPKTYEWNATLTKNKEQQYELNSGWKRIGK